MTEAQLKQLTAWYHAEYKRRSDAIMSGEAKIDWLAPEYRVSRTEIASHAESIGFTMTVQDTIDFFHHLSRSKYD